MKAACLILAVLLADRPSLPGPEKAKPTPAPKDLAGVWTVTHQEDGYTGHVILVPARKGYKVSWVLLAPAMLKTPFGLVATKKTVTFEGYGERKGNTLTVAWTSGDGVGLSHYTIAGDTVTGNGEVWRYLVIE